jgi:hypothetical protein
MFGESIASISGFKMDATRSSQKLAPAYNTTRRHNTEDHNRNFYCRENHKSHGTEHSGSIKCGEFLD